MNDGSEPRAGPPGPAPIERPEASPGGLAEIAGVFLKLGCLSFGGPVAHLGYFRAEFVEKHRWLADTHFGDLVALCQFLPGPASSQLVFSVGMLRAGLAGAVLASELGGRARAQACGAGRTRTRTCLWNGVPAISSRHAASVRWFTAGPVVVRPGPSPAPGCSVP